MSAVSGFTRLRRCSSGSIVGAISSTVVSLYHLVSWNEWNIEKETKNRKSWCTTEQRVMQVRVGLWENVNAWQLMEAQQHSNLATCHISQFCCVYTKSWQRRTPSWGEPLFIWIHPFISWRQTIFGVQVVSNSCFKRPKCKMNKWMYAFLLHEGRRVTLLWIKPLRGMQVILVVAQGSPSSTSSHPSFGWVLKHQEHLFLSVLGSAYSVLTQLLTLS